MIVLAARKSTSLLLFMWFSPMGVSWMEMPCKTGFHSVFLADIHRGRQDHWYMA